MEKRLLVVALFFFDREELYLSTTDITNLGKGIVDFLNELTIHLELGELNEVLDDDFASELKDTLIEIDSMLERNFRTSVILETLFHMLPNVLAECSVKYKVIENE